MATGRACGRHAPSAALLVLALTVAHGCRDTGSPAPRSDSASTASDFIARPGSSSFPISGRVVSVDASARSVTIAHDEIPTFMKAMTMSFAVKEAWVVDAVKPGSLVTATLVVDGARTWLEQVVVADPSAQPLPADSTTPPRP